MPKKPATKKASPKKSSKSVDYPALVEELGSLAAQIAELEERKNEIKRELTASKLKEIKREHYSVKISRFDVSRVDYKGLALSYSPTKSLLNKYTNTTEESRVTLTANK